jgi:hypothetical protein
VAKNVPKSSIPVKGKAWLSVVTLPERFRIVTLTPATSGTFVANVTVRVLALAGKKVLCDICFTTKEGWYTFNGYASP